MKLAPDRKKFLEVLGDSGTLNADMEKFVVTFAPFLEENHKFLVSSFIYDRASNSEIFLFYTLI